MAEINFPQLSSEPDHGERVDTFTVEELIAQLQADAGLAKSLADQLGLDSPDANTIVAALMEQFSGVQEDINNLVKDNNIIKID